MSERGSLTVEAALILPLVGLALLAIVEVFSLVGTRLDMVAAAREGVRVAATVPDPARAADVAKEVLGDLAPLARVVVRRPDVAGRLAAVEITVRRPLRTPFLSAMRIEMTSKAVMRVER